MTQKDWAEKEIELACKQENPDWDGKSFDYGCSCYQSALKAYKSLCEDGHSGCSWSITMRILERLMEGLPLRPITEEDFEGVEPYCPEGKIQCPRMSSLFKGIDDNGNVTYTDINRSYSINIHNPHKMFSGGDTRIIDRLFPIELPYLPTFGKYKVYVEEFLTDKKNGDFDTEGFLYCFTPDNKRVEINEFYAEKNGEMVKISKEEYEERKKNKLYEFEDEQ